MRGGKGGHRKKSSRVPDQRDIDALELQAKQEKEDKRKQHHSKKADKKSKDKKNWRFAYDLYCKELISSNQPQSQRSDQNRLDSQGGQSNGKGGSNLIRHTHSNSISRRERIIQHAKDNATAGSNVLMQQDVVKENQHALVRAHHSK